MSSSSYNPNITLTSLSTQQGEINLVTNPIAENDVSSWTTSSATLTRSTTGVLSPVIPTGFSASSTTSTTSYVQTSLLTVPATLRNRKLKVQLYIQCADTATWKVDVFKSDGSTRYTLSTDSSAVSALPALTGTYTTTFDMDTGSGIYVRLTRYAGSGTSTLSFTNLIVGPGIQPQGAAVQNSLTYTLTIGGTTTAPTPGTNTSVASYVRVGDMMKLNYSFRQTALGSAAGSGTYLFPLPTGLTIDSTRIGSFAIEGNSILGAAEINNGTTTLIGVVLPYNSTNLIIQVGNDTTAPTYVSSTFYQVNTNTNLRYSFEAMLPIAEWAGSGTVQLAQNDVEYAWNSDPGTTAGTTYSNSTYYGYGPNGTLIPAIASTTTTGESKTVYTVVFQTPVQSTDQVVIELNDGNGWFNAAQRFPPFTNNAASYGVLLIAINSTTYRVAFGNAGYGTSGATTYGAAGGAWSGVTSWRWRVRKSSAGAAVGFGIVQPGVSSGLVSASGVPGNTTGNTIASGYVGEQRRVTYSSVTIAGTATQLAVISNVTPGTYLVRFAGDSVVGTTTRIIYSLNTTVAVDSTQSGETFWDAASTPSGAGALVCQGMRYLSVTTTISNYYLVAVASTASSTSARGIFEIIRIA